MPLTTSRNPPLYVTLVAGALSSFGFGLSVVALWVLWLIPSTKPDPPPSILTKTKATKSRRRSAPATLETPTRRSRMISGPPPTTVSPVTSDTALHNASRHVYFADSPKSQSPRTIPPLEREDPILRQKEQQISPDGRSGSKSCVVPPGDTSSPRSSSSTLVSTCTPPKSQSTPLAPLDSTEESIAESDHSRRSSTRPVMRLPNILGKGRRRASEGVSFAPEKAHINQAKDFCTSSPEHLTVVRSDTLPADFNHRPKRSKRPHSSSASFPFCHSRTQSNPSASTLTANAPTSRSYFLRRSSKAEKWMPSSPATGPAPTARSVPRTQPYEYPYFAAPPIPIASQRDPDDNGASSEQGRDLQSGAAGERERKDVNETLPASLSRTRPGDSPRTGGNRIVSASEVI